MHPLPKLELHGARWEPAEVKKEDDFARLATTLVGSWCSFDLSLPSQKELLLRAEEIAINQSDNRTKT